MRDCWGCNLRDTSLQRRYVRRFHQKDVLAQLRLWRVWQISHAGRVGLRRMMFLNKLQSKQSEEGWKLRNNCWGESNDRKRETGCVKKELGGGGEGCHRSEYRTCCRSPQHLHNVGKKGSSLSAAVTPQATLRLSLFCRNSLARPLIVIHPSRTPVYKREIRISITRAQRQRDWWVSHRIPSVFYPSLCFTTEKWTLSSAMIRFSLHISIQESVLSGWYTIPMWRQPAQGLWKSNIIRLFGLLDLLFMEWAGDTFDITVEDNVTRQNLIWLKCFCQTIVWRMMGKICANRFWVGCAKTKIPTVLRESLW